MLINFVKLPILLTIQIFNLIIITLYSFLQREVNMKKILGVITGATLLALSGQAFSADNEVSLEIWTGGKIYDRAFGRGCGTCHDISSNPNLFVSVKDLSKEEFISVLKNGQNGMPKAIGAIMDIKLVKKAGYSEDEAMNAIYAYIKGRADGSVPEGKLKKAK